MCHIHFFFPNTEASKKEDNEIPEMPHFINDTAIPIKKELGQIDFNDHYLVWLELKNKPASSYEAGF